MGAEWKNINENYKNLDGYKRVAWPPLAEERIVREFTPQPQGQFPPTQQQPPSQSPQPATTAAGVASPITTLQPSNQKPTSIQQQQQQPQPQYQAASFVSQYNYQPQRAETQTYQQAVPYQQQQQQQQQQQHQQQPNWLHPTSQTATSAWQQQQQQPPYQPIQQPTQYKFQQQLLQQQQQQQQHPQTNNQFDQNHYNSYSQPLQQQQPYPQDYSGGSPGIITLRKEAPVSQKPAPVFTSQPAAVSYKGGTKMRGDLKWPPPEYKEQFAREEEERRQLSLGPACKPTKIKRDYTEFFAKHQLNSYYPSYKVPPGTQHMTA